MLNELSASELEFKVQERAIIYARVSTDEQAETGTSLDRQVEKSLEYAESCGMHIVAIFREDYSGKELNRPELDKVRAMLKSRQADTLIAYKPNRLDRSEWGIGLLQLMAELKEIGVSLHYSQDKRQVDLNNPMEAFMYGSFAGWQAGEDHRETVKKLWDGRKDKARRGSPIVHDRAPYGYTAHRLPDKSWELEIEETQGGVVKMLYEWYVFGDETKKKLSDYAIAKKLTAMGIPSPGDLEKKFRKTRKGWHRTTVGEILKSETYKGTWYYGKYNKGRKRKASDTRRNVTINPRSEWIPVDVPAIIDPETWQMAQDRRKKNKRQSNRNTKYEYLLSKLLTCGHCTFKARSRTAHNGSSSKKYTYYSCNSYSRGDKCDLPSFPVEIVDAKVWEFVEEILTDDERRRAALASYQKKTASQANPIREEVATVKSLIESQTAEWENAVATLKAATSPRAKAMFAQDVERLEGTLDALEERKLSLQAKLESTTLTDEQSEYIDRMITEVAKGLDKARKDFNARRRLVEILQVEGVLIVEDGKRYVDVSACFGTLEQRLLIEGGTTRNTGFNMQRITVRLAID